MSANLDKSLDDLVGSRRQNARRRSNNRRAAAKPSVGGVKKSKPTKAAPKAAHPAPKAAPAVSSKIIVSGLPADVSEANIKEYFIKSAGPVKKVMLTYNQNGTSRGIASIIFAKPDTAHKAAKELNGLLVDGRPMKIEVVYDASHAPAVPTPKPLTERVAQKSQPKPATAAKAAKGKGKTNTNDKNATGRNPNGRTRKGRNPGRGKPKTVEELDAEMVDYFTNENAPAAGNAPVNGTAPQATNAGEDLGMAEIS
ncbi:mRNA export protein mlo3 [Penicillium cinerascens]|uniref:mRNA export protein mlo3 n=1 Tax=Penicillium cinerascens TaxID=70096 RepID=A0A9W9MAJ7_9EURO|nr:mRNA export protein mlo3 [Penicillium cinerascens]KAJ5194888.1 mRNA export protein mlo3 [Penicillium cinerascens]